jgi:hypothetical protein
MSFQINQFALFMACFIGLFAFSAYSIRTMRRTGIARYLWNLLLAVKIIVGAMSKLVMGFVGLLAASTVTSEDEDSIDDGDLTGAYNFRTRKFDNGTDPYGWYEEDL